jgi:hypothetical protein
MGQNPRDTESDCSKRKHECEESGLEDEPRKMHGKRIDYKRMADPFSDDDKCQETIYAIMSESQFGDEPQTLEEAKHSLNWEEWERAVKAELGQLYHKGTWSLVDRPESAVPISNKWVFTRKYNKDGTIQKYKVRLVAKGCAQQLGYNYVETFSPDVRLETIRAIWNDKIVLNTANGC